MPRDSVKVKMLALFLCVILGAIMVSGCTSNSNCSYYVDVGFNGDVNRPTMFLELSNIGFNPQVSTSSNDSLYLSPMCNNSFLITQANEQKVLTKITSAATTKFTKGLGWSFYIALKDSSESAKDMGPFYKSWTTCVKDILINRIVKDLNMTKAYEKPIGKCYQPPGFTAGLALAAVPVVAFILKGKRT